MADYSDCYFTNADGLQQYYRDYGNPFEGAEIMLCIPGLTRNSRDFSHVADQFAPHFRVIAVDLRGRGKSDYDPQPERYQPVTYVSDISALLAHLSVDSVHICGTSLGGIITMILQAMKPGVVKSAIINDIGPEIDPKGIAHIKTYVGKTPILESWEQAVMLMKAGAAKIYPDFTHNQWEDFTARLFVMRDGRPVPDYDPNIAKPFESDTDTAAPDLWPVFQAMISVPTMLVRGDLSDLLTVATAEKMQQQHSDFKLVSVPRVGHAPILNEDSVIAAFDTWIKRFSPPRSA